MPTTTVRTANKAAKIEPMGGKNARIMEQYEKTVGTGFAISLKEECSISEQIIMEHLTTTGVLLYV